MQLLRRSPDEYLNIGFFGVLLASVLIGKFMVLTQTGSPNGSDIDLHLMLTQGWAEMEWPLFNEDYYNNGYPRPPALHITVAFLSAISLREPIAIFRLLEVALLPGILVSTFLVVNRLMGTPAALLSTLLMASSPAFLDRGGQVIPQALDLLLIPPLFYSYVTRKKKSFIALGTYLIYNHWFYALLPIFGLSLHSALRDRAWIRDFLWIGVLSIPLAMVMFYHAPAMVMESAGLNELQEAGVINEPLFAVKYLGYPLFFIFFLVGIHLRFKKPDESGYMVLFWIAGLLPMLIFFPDRFLGYVAMPLGILGALTFLDLVKPNAIFKMTALCLLLFDLMTFYYFNQALITTGDVWMPLDTLSPFVVGMKP